MITAYNCAGTAIDHDAPSFEVEVLASGENTYVSNRLRFSTIDGASEYAIDLMARWTAVQAWRIVDSFDPPNRD